MNLFRKLLCILFAVACLVSNRSPAKAEVPASEKTRHTFAIGTNDFLLDNQPFVIRCGEIHFPRVPLEYWQQRLQMCRAMGLNTVCVYLFWNFHEWQQGKFDWTGQADAAEFCRLAQKEGLWVVLRPGPYSCAEWEMGGLPWWLLKNETINLRSRDPQFLNPAVRYLKEIGRVLSPLQVTHGGPILMVQVENEYGSFGNDSEYLGALRQAMIDGGIDVPLFACNPPGAIANGYRSDLFQVVNFGANASVKAFDRLREFQKTGPLMNGEYYPGWFDTWGRKHRTGSVEPVIADLEYMLKNHRSFSIYMAHGGTSFGLWSGADRPFKPDTSSYDYDAPINEAGHPTPKFYAIRELFRRYLLPGETIPEPPSTQVSIAVPRFTLSEVAPVFFNLPKPKQSELPGTMESYDQSRGLILYRTTIPAGAAASLTVKEVHDFAWVFVNGKPLGAMDRRSGHYRVQLPARTAAAQLDILIEAMGRVNFGSEVADRKGLHTPVRLGDSEVKNWEVFSLPLDAEQLANLKFSANDSDATKLPAFWRGSFKLNKLGDTFLALRSWGKGVVWVNGHCLGRFWNIGPTQTMYCPAPWLKSTNEIVVLDLVGPQQPAIAGLENPILDELHPELDFAKRVRASGNFNTQGKPVAEGAFNAEIQWQEARFAQPTTARYVCLEALDSTDGSPQTAIAELDLTDAKGKSLPKETWKVLWVSSEETEASPGDADQILDGQPATFWITRSGSRNGFPHRIVLDLGRSETIAALRYLPRGGKPSDPGRIRNFRIYASDQPFGLIPPNDKAP